MIVTCVSDTHGALPAAIPECDLLVVAGDFAAGMGPAQEQGYILGEFSNWLRRAPVTDAVVVAGNHEHCVQRWGWPRQVPAIYLEDSGVTLQGQKIWGTPWQPWFLDWAFNAPKRDTKEDFLRDKFAMIPDDTDIIVAHTPPWGVLDRNSRGKKCGSRALLMRMLEIKPKLLVCGHIHDSGGQTQMVNDTLVVNAACWRQGFDYDPVVVDIV